MDLVSPQLEGGASFNVASLKGKVVAVYYWASYVGVTVGDFARLKQLHNTYGAKGFELVCANLDDTSEAALRFLKDNTCPGHHLWEAAKEGGGLNSPLATSYGIMGLPHLILIGRDGRVVTRTLQVGDLEDAIKKAL
jgi:hypothetical protein